MALRLQWLLARRDVCGNKAKRFFFCFLFFIAVRFHTLFSIVKHNVAYVVSHKRLGAASAVINKSTHMLHCNVQDWVFQYNAQN